MKIFLLSVLLFQAISALVSHENEQVWRIFTSPTNTELRPLIDHLNLDVLSARTDSIDILVTPDILAVVEGKVKSLGLSYDILIEDIQKIIDDQEHGRRFRNIHQVQPQASIDINVYHTLDEINAYIDELAIDVDFVTVETIGQSVEGRDMKLVKLSTQPNNPTAMWVHCGVHAREWVSPASCIFALDYFTNNYGIDADITAFLDSSDIYILTVANPDGYLYSWSDDRLWRKNRRVNEGSTCLGVDLNRNYDDGLSWGLDGASDLPCAATYYGESGFSEPELVSIRDKVISIQATQTMKSFYDVHSYSNLWMYAYAFLSEDSDFKDELDVVSETATSAMNALFGTTIVYGPHFSTIYQASGTSLDWAYSRGIIHSYILELRDNGEFGFLLPEDQIVPTATECWTGIMAADGAM